MTLYRERTRMFTAVQVLPVNKDRLLSLRGVRLVRPDVYHVTWGSGPYSSLASLGDWVMLDHPSGQVVQVATEKVFRTGFEEVVS